ncbi:3D (Asp-Asp-Asp) domain-containing protein [Halobacillus alkaliphilus]|uniref:3D (Asp-Asp-Asp) domain-containing protein n=1 Tax=Halobacillus alkaliphilus TaxID=396056 RepID=A0A1I2MYX4_9BACI|nr:3D (Asp-Asp-Asp) domain-containing protein [Halobacillus alkaliphilus]
MKKSWILLFSIAFYTLGILSFSPHSQSTIAAEELDKPAETAQEVNKKSSEINKKSTTHKRFEQEEKKQSESKAKEDKSKSEVKRTVTVEATAYTAFCDGCSGKTSTGIDLRENPDKKVIAVDPDVIPLGSKVRVPGYGVAIAGDIGADIEGRRIDVFLPEKDEAFDFGRRDVQVEILHS